MSKTQCKHGKDNLWLTCIHVKNGTANEVWLRPDSIGVCPICAIRDPRLIPDEELSSVCGHCFKEIVRGLEVIRGEQFLYATR
jgi:hypothetical protein